ncbi:glycosyltransferase family 2 protein [Serpentinicella sp. ANB-PHB4]|uniref:glycosyltransferase family 2 protein n=1 Tax=Serpentinicella sp. ANB-PHB4 TaxID=3074076 RepID=UPI00285B7696|nr:glycosyltransferase family 2 protein [Serpentinicella sp. ANB-PHB4]MDR5658175.1 glycosyltransferase family 2 protein [Serpentinicella sp. ANB-PHB4]
MNKTISVIVPAYNEEFKIEETIKAIQSVDLINNIHVVDDGSTDNTFSILSNIEGISVNRFSVNVGKGAAIKAGIREVIDFSDIIVFLDGDLGSSAKEVYKLITPLLYDNVDVVIGRFPKAKTKGGFGFVKSTARYGVYLRTGQLFHASLCGQRAFKTNVLTNITLPDDFGIEVSMLVNIINKGYTVKEINVNMTHNETKRNFQGFKHRAKQLLQVLKALIKK